MIITYKIKDWKAGTIIEPMVLGEAHTQKLALMVLEEVKKLELPNAVIAHIELRVSVDTECDPAEMGKPLTRVYSYTSKPGEKTVKTVTDVALNQEREAFEALVKKLGNEPPEPPQESQR